MSALVSIIIPVYNIEKYIANCLDSVISQTYKNLEIICIDDGSRDSSGEILKSYAEKDSRIVCIYQDNAGVSAARNKGLDNFHGDYVMFVDGDDYLHYQAVEIFVNCIESTNSNIVFSDCELTDKQNSDMSVISSYNSKKICDGNLFERYYDITPWAKIFRSEIIKPFRFPEGICNSEDYCFLMKVLYSTRNSIGYYLDCKLYYYYIRSGSAVNASFSRSKLTEITAYNLVLEFLNDKEDCNVKKHAITSMFKLLLRIRTQTLYSEYEEEAKKMIKASWNKWHLLLWKYKGISFKEKIIFTVFYYSRHFYEFMRVKQDPTMKDYLENRKKQK